ncbi:hydroxysteroid dehydrogenase [Yokapox virus]|uniref:3 beta-hydroxysteroid dehydrogenase/Delta 5-->4-isomerase n=1 Tax=Yokapox virus TaxID=1076255 RepID=G3EI41_9POXV|nr:hydroxysteroid dehydrogenase [Yokapox virus]AEN03738.1 hydroxysteroid dehydrogenase [Yokapox virus]
MINSKLCLKLNMSVYAVTGGAGFLGKHIVKLLINRCPYVTEIRVIDIRRDREPYRSESKRIKYICCDINDYDTLYKELNGCNVIIHTAAIANMYYGRYKDSDILRVNYYGTETILSICVHLGIQYLIYTSGMEVVGPNIYGDQFVGDECTQYNITHRGVYAKSKYNAEHIVMSANGSILINGKKLYTCCLRPTGIYGEGDIIMRDIYIQCLNKGKIMNRFTDDSAIYSRVYVGNVAWMHILASRHIQYTNSIVRGNFYFCYDYSPRCSYDSFNLLLMKPLGIQSGPRFSKLALKTMALKNDLFTKLFNIPSLINSYTIKTSNTRFEVQTNKAKIHFNYEPIFSLSESFTRTSSWLKNFS